MTKINIIAASSGKNLELARMLEEELKTHDGVQTEVIDLCALDIPLYKANAESGGIPEVAQELRDKVSQCQGLVFVAPEYNGSLPPTLNNAIAWISVSTKDWRQAFNGKPAAVATHSGSGGSYVLAAMRHQLSYIGVNVIGRQIHTHMKKALGPKTATAVMSDLVRLSQA